MHQIFDFSRALGLVPLLCKDSDRTRLWLRRDQEIDANVGQMPVLEGELVRSGCEMAGRRGEFKLNESPPSAQFVEPGEFRRGEFQVQVSLIQQKSEVAF